MSDTKIEDAVFTDEPRKTAEKEPSGGVVHGHAEPPPASESRAVAIPTTMSMLDRAVTSNAPVEVLERLLALHERWEAGQSRKAFDMALSLAKAEMPVIKKNRRVGFESKRTDTRTDYAHEDLAEIARSIDPILGKHGLSYRFRTDSSEAKIKVTCIISHRDGYSEENTLISDRDNSGNKNTIQAIGSAVTYLQRYSLKAALGLSASEDDDDGQGAGETQPQRDNGPPRRQQAQQREKPPERTEQREAAPQQDQTPRKVTGGKDAHDWASIYLDLLKTSGDGPTFYKWIELNRETLDRCANDHPGVWQTIKTESEKHLGWIQRTAQENATKGGTPEDAAKKDAGPSKPRTRRSTKAASVTADSAVPTDPEEKLVWIDLVLAGVKVPDDLADIWTDKCEPVVDAMDFPADKEKAQSIYREHEKRLGIE